MACVEYLENCSSIGDAIPMRWHDLCYRIVVGAKLDIEQAFKYLSSDFGLSKMIAVSLLGFLCCISGLYIYSWSPLQCVALMLTYYSNGQYLLPGLYLNETSTITLRLHYAFIALRYL